VTCTRRKLETFSADRTITDRGEGANNAIVDVLDFVETVLPQYQGSYSEIRAALDEYEQKVISRARPTVLASRRACLDAHEWKRIRATSPLLSKRTMHLKFDDEDML